METALIQGLLKTGAPWGILCAALTVALVVLWRRYVATSDRLYDLALAQMQKDEQIHATLARVREDVEEIRRTK